MNSIERKRRRSNWLILGVSALGIVLANAFNTPQIANDAVILFSTVMGLSMLFGIVGLVTD